MLLKTGVGGADDIAGARDEAYGLGLFIRSLVDLDREAATEAFDEFMRPPTGEPVGASRSTDGLPSGHQSVSAGERGWNRP